MKDFKNTFEQSTWEFAANSHFRACQRIAALTGKEHLKKHLEYWTKARKELEEKFPILRKPF